MKLALAILGILVLLCLIVYKMNVVTRQIEEQERRIELEEQENLEKA